MPWIVLGQIAQMTEHPPDPLHRVAVMGQIAILAGHDESPAGCFGVRQAQYQFLDSAQHLVRSGNQLRRFGLLGGAIIQESLDAQQKGQGKSESANDLPVE